MEIIRGNISAILLTTAVISLFSWIYKKWRDYRRMWSHAIHIPGPTGVPVLGSIPSQLKALRNNQIRELRLQDCIKYKYIHKYYGLARIVVFVYNPQDMEAILTNTKLITKGQAIELFQDWLGTGLFTSTGTKWKSRRKILTPAFHFSILQDFLGIFNREAEILVETLKQNINQPTNIIEPITEFTLSAVGQTSLGVQINNEENCNEYKKAIYDFGELFMERCFRPWLNFPIIKQLHPTSRKITQTVNALHDFSTKIIQIRKKQVETSGSYSTNKRLALLDLLLRTKYTEGFNIDDEGIREEVDTFMFAGHDTIAVSLCYTLVILANEPKIQEEMYQEIMDFVGDWKRRPDSKDLANLTFMERCIKESLRLYPSATSVVRKATEDVATKDGYVIPKGADIELAISAMHRLPYLWDDPDKFDPDRFLPENVANRHPFAYLPFSAGPRNCIGQNFAMMEMKVVLCCILKAFKLESVTKREELKFKMDIVLRPLGELNVKFIPRKIKF